MPDEKAATAHPKELRLPDEAMTTSGSAEVLRAWIVGGGLQVSLISAFDKPALWGLLLADVARYAARAFELDGICSSGEAMRQIVDRLDAELDAPTDLGSTAPVRKQ